MIQQGQKFVLVSLHLNIDDNMCEVTTIKYLELLSVSFVFCRADLYIVSSLGCYLGGH